MQTLTIRNDFHGTRTWILTDRPLTKARIASVRRRLCGCRDCKCGDALGGRGPQDPGYVAVLDQAIALR